MFFAPDRRNQCTRFSVHGNRWHCIPPRNLDWCHVEPERVAVAVGTTNVKSRMALQARCTGALSRLAQLADCVVSKRWRSDALDHIQAGRVAEFDFSVPEGTVHVYPVVVGSALEWLPGHKRPALFLLSEAILVLGSVNKLLL